MLWLCGLSLLSSTMADLQIEGWHVHVERALISTRPKLWCEVKAELGSQLFQIRRVVPAAPLAKLRGVAIWVSLNDPETKGAAFHPSADWLSEHHLNPKMAHGLEIGNAENFVTWTHEQPWMVLHELAHAYHFLFLDKSYENSDIKAAYDKAMASHLYDSVLRYDGNKGRHYACTNAMEFFAEMTESYFGVNDFFPFVNAELRTYDPDTYAVMKMVWGVPARTAPSG
jgi:hypothetical protein